MLLATIGLILIAAVDFIPLLRKRRWRDVAAWLIMFIPAFAFALLAKMKVDVPNVMLLVGDALKAIGLSY